MKRVLVIAVLFGSIVYSVNAEAQSTQPAMSPAMSPVAVVMRSPKTLEPMRSSVVSTAMSPVAPAMASQPAPAVMALPMAPVMAPSKSKPVTSPAASPAATQEPTKVAPKGSGWDKVDKWVSRITSLLLALLTIIGLILGWTKQKDWRQKLKSNRWQKIFGYADDAFPMIESIAKATGWKGDDKLVEFLKRVNDWLKGEGEHELSVEEVALLRKEAADKAALARADIGAEVEEKSVKREK